MSPAFNLPSPSPLRTNPPEADGPEVLGICYSCRCELGEIAYQHPEINESLCPQCAYRSMLNVLRETPLDELDGIPAIERAVTCRDCGYYTTDCRCP